MLCLGQLDVGWRRLSLSDQQPLRQGVQHEQDTCADLKRIQGGNFLPPTEEMVCHRNR